MSVNGPDLVWCKRCGVHQALKARGGVCPVCDPRQGSEASSRAQSTLDRIDAVSDLPPVASSLGARWTPGRDDLVPDPLRNVGPGEITGDRAGNRPTFETYDESTILTSAALRGDRVYFVDFDGAQHDISAGITAVTVTNAYDDPEGEPVTLGPFPLSVDGTARFTIPIPDDAQLGFDPEPDWSSWRDQFASLRAFMRRMFDLTTPAPRDEELPRGS